MKPAPETDGLKLTEEEAYSLLGLAMTSPQLLDATSEKALRKLAEFCVQHCHHYSRIEIPRELFSDQPVKQRELAEAGV